jgi:hypothetical protein
MNDGTAVPEESQATTRPYRPPQKLLVPCPTCGVTVLRGLMVEGRIKKQSPPLTPVLGEVHACARDTHGESLQSTQA